MASDGFGGTLKAPPPPVPVVLPACGSDYVSGVIAWAKGVAKSVGSVPITYTREDETIALCAIPERYAFRIADAAGNSRLEWSDRDYLIDPADLVIGGLAVEPARGDRITEYDGSIIRHFEVRAPGGEPPWRYNDERRTYFRVHTKAVGKE